MPRPPNPQLKPELFKNCFPQFDGLPVIDLRVLMWHFLSADAVTIAIRCGIKTEDVIRILDRHDPDRTLALNREIKLAYIDHSLLDMAAALISTVTEQELRGIKGADAKIAACERMLRIHMKLAPHIPEQPKTEDGAGTALERMKKCH